MARRPVWLRRLANPNNQPPYFTLGRGSDASSPYVAFARTLAAWRHVLHTNRTAAWPLAGLAISYAHSRGSLAQARGAALWVDKTPTNERFVKQLKKRISGCQVHSDAAAPVAVYASRKKAEQGRFASFAAARRVLADLGLSHQHRDEVDRFAVVRYEDLVADTATTMQRIAKFLQIEWLPILLRPTVAGMPATSTAHLPAPPPAPSGRQKPTLLGYTPPPREGWP